MTVPLYHRGIAMRAHRGAMTVPRPGHGVMARHVTP